MQLIKTTTLFTTLFWMAMPAFASAVTVTDVAGNPLAGVMVTQSAEAPTPIDKSDNGYPQPNKPYTVDIDVTRFTDNSGRATFVPRAGKIHLRLRKPGYKDFETTMEGKSAIRQALQKETDANRLADTKPANAWLGALDLGGNADTRIHFQMQCGFCHQQGNVFLHRERSAAEWKSAIDRMIRYGSRLPTALQKSMPETLHAGYKKLREHPELIGPLQNWGGDLAGIEITEWPVGDSLSQMHDMLVGKNGLVYVADNIQDRLYEVDYQRNVVSVYKIPHRRFDFSGGLIAGRLKDFPRHDSTSNAHSLAVAADGHIFITPSAQRRLIEFDPVSKEFALHEMADGFYPHTIRIDGRDDVWFTLALSNQVAKFDRRAKKFTLYDLPTRSFKERMTVFFIGSIFKLINLGIPLPNWLAIDDISSGTPLPYGIDITPDGKIWFSRLHTREIGFVDPQSGQVTMIATPFAGPRRLRSDAEGNLWITSFGESKIARYEPKFGKFTQFDLPVLPKGSETPYALHVDKLRRVVWVTGNQSDSVFAFDIKKHSWKQIPLPRRTTFTRDFEILPDGSVFTSNSNFPSWHVEGAQPTLIRIVQK